jgi:HK97 family phage major capsid protein
MSDFKTTVRELGRELEAKQAEAKTAWAEFSKLRDDAAKLGADLVTNEDAFTKLDEAGKAYDGICDQINGMQAKYNRLMELSADGAPAMPATEAKTEQGVQDDSPFARFKASETWDHIAKRKGMQFGVTPGSEVARKAEVKTLMTTTAYPSMQFQRPGIIPLPQPALTILDLIQMIPTDKETVEYTYEKTFTNTAAETAEGVDASIASEGTLAFDDGEVSCKWIPFVIPSTRQLLSDEPRLEAWINERLIRGVKTRLQTEIINGGGTGQDLTGIANWANILTQDCGADDVFAQIHKAKTKILVNTYANYSPNAILLHPDDYERCILAMDGEDRYYFGGPLADGARSIWGMVPVVHTSVSEGTPIVLDLGVAECYVREGVQVSVSDSHDDYFTKNKLMWKAQGRFAFLISQAKAVCECTDFGS